MVRGTLVQYVAVCPSLQLTSHTQEASTLSRIKCERYIFIKKCVRSFDRSLKFVIIVDRFCIYLYICLWLNNTPCIDEGCGFLAFHPYFYCWQRSVMRHHWLEMVTIGTPVSLCLCLLIKCTVRHTNNTSF